MYQRTVVGITILLTRNVGIKFSCGQSLQLTLTIIIQWTCIELKMKIIKIFALFL